MIDAKNPYIGATGEAELKPSVVAFVDILGFKELAIKAREHATAADLLFRLRRALRTSLDQLRYYEKPDAPGADLYRMRIFTDNIVIAHPIFEDAEMELGMIFTQLAVFQSLMATHGFFVRGGVAIGEIVIDEDIVFGPGLIKAYEAESGLARDPRIVLTEEAAEAVRSHTGYYGEVSDSPQASEFLVDADGQLFINYLHAALLDGASRFEIISHHKKAVEDQLRTMKNRPQLWSKYAWAATYHNFFCAQYEEQLPGAVSIDMAEFALRPQRLAPRSPGKTEGATRVRGR
jgi:hypothetical protein